MKSVLEPPVHFGQSVSQIVTSDNDIQDEYVCSNSNDYTGLLDDACKWIRNSKLPYVEQFLIILLLRNGLRVCEICNPSNIRIIDKYHVYVYSTKNKVWRQVQTAEATDLLDDDTVTADLPIWRRNRQYYYRAMKGLLVGVETSRTCNQAVTHAARNIQAQTTFQATGSMEATKLSIGNKSERATTRYINRKQRQALQTKGADNPLSGTISGVNSTKQGVIRRRR